MKLDVLDFIFLSVQLLLNYETIFIGEKWLFIGEIW